ncbi:putative reverse transcriptase domain-containing protein [Tanacetum coccineum]
MKEASEIGSNSESPCYVAIDNEAKSDLESTTRSEPKCKEMEDTCESGVQIAPTRRSGPSNDENPDITAIIVQQLKNIIPKFISQVTDNVNNANANGGNGGNANGGNNGFSYKAFLACNPRDYDGKGGAVALTSSFINKALTWWNTQLQPRGREATIGMTWVEFKALLMEEFCPSNKMEKLESDAILKVGILTDEAVRCGTLIRSSEKRKEVEETNKQGGSWKDNKKAKVGKGFVATTPPRNENVGLYSKCAKCSAYHPEGGPCKLCYNCQKPGHFARDCRAPVKQVAPISTVRMGNNQRVCYECGSSKHLRNTYPKLNRAPRQDLNVVTGTFSLNDHFATVLFDSEADFSFISTKFVPLLNVKPSIVSPGYVIEVANGKKEEIDRIICNCKLELVNSLFTIDLISLGHGSFDVIVGMDWLSKNKAEIVCYEKMVRIPLEGGEILHV